MLADDHITLRAPEPEDLEFLYRTENEPALWIYSARKEPYSRFALRQYIKNCDQSVFERGQLRFVIKENTSGAPIGTIDLFDFDYYNGKAELGIFVDTPYRRQGYAQRAIGLLAEYARRFLHLHQLYAYVETENAASRHTLTKAGFCHTATLADWLQRDSRFVDIALLQYVL